MTADHSNPTGNVDYFEDLTGDIEPIAESHCDQIGDRIKQVRKDKGLNISKLSHLTGFDEQMLQQIEDNTICPQLGTVIKLSKALDSALQRLISPEGQHLYSVTRRNEQKVVSRTTTQDGRQSAYTYMSLAPDVRGRHMEALIVDLKKIPEEERSIHAGEEFIYVLEGIVNLDIGDDHFELQPGDSAYYISTTPHLLTAQQDKARILAVIYSA